MSDAAVLAAPAPGLERRWRINHLLLVLNFAAVAAALLLWWTATSLGWVAPIFLPSPGDVLHAGRITLASGDLVTDILVSARRVFLGFALAAAVGTNRTAAATATTEESAAQGEAHPTQAGGHGTKFYGHPCFFLPAW